MSLLEKISAIEIKADTRISDADREYCKAHQKAYEEAKATLIKLETLWDGFIKSQEETLNEKICSQYEKHRYTVIDGLSSHSLSTKIAGLPEIFVESIVSYFNSKYHVSVSSLKIKGVLVPKAPSYNWEKSRIEEYNDAIRALTLNYEDVVEQIFVQLGGRTFEQRALDELKEKCHDFAWRTSTGKAEYELHNDTIQFEYGCSYESWCSRTVWKVRDGMKDVLRSIAHFETQQLDYLPKDIAFLVGYDDKCSSTYDFDYEKVKKIRMFKNHRVDIKFSSKELAHQFAEQYLGLVA